jgi:putative addiction module CopG family antidote
MSLALTPQTEEEILDWIESGQFPDADAVIHQALQALKDRQEARFLTLRELVLAGHNSGKSEELTSKL